MPIVRSGKFVPALDRPGRVVLDDRQSVLPVKLSSGVLSANVQPFLFLFRDDFLSDELTPLASPRAAEPGPGTLTLVQIDGEFSIVAGELNFPAQDTPGWVNQTLATTAFTRNPGVIVLHIINYDDLLGRSAIGWWENTGLSPSVDADVEEMSLMWLDASIFMRDTSGVGGPQATYLATEQKHFHVLRSLGCFYVIDNTLHWVSNTRNTSALYAGLSNLDADGKLNSLRIADLPANNFPVWDHGDLDQTDAIAAPAVGNTFSHTADGVLKFTLVSIGAGTIDVRFRLLDSTNYWFIKITAAGGFQLWSSVDGGLNLFLNAGNVLVGGEVITCTFDGTVITLWYDDTKVGPYSAAVDFQALTDGKVHGLGGGVLANLTTRTLDQRIATDILEAPRSAGDTFTHEANFVAEFVLDALPSASYQSFFFRIQDSDNRWELEAISDGRWVLYEVVAGGFTSRASVAGGTLTGGERLVVIADDEAINCYYDNTVGPIYTNATNFKTETDGELDKLGTGGAVSDIIIYPRILGGETISLGPELITNGDFSAWTADDPDGWTVTGEVASDPEVSEVGSGESHGGAGTDACNLFSSVTSEQPRITQVIMTGGETYEISVIISAISGTLRIRDTGNGLTKNFTTTGTHTFRGSAIGEIIEVRAEVSGTDVTIDSISVKRVSPTYGNNSAKQALDSMAVAGGASIPLLLITEDNDILITEAGVRFAADIG